MPGGRPGLMRDARVPANRRFCGIANAAKRYSIPVKLIEAIGSVQLSMQRLILLG